MSLSNPTGEWLKQDIDKMLKLLAIIESPDFQSHIWPDLPDAFENGTRIAQMPYPVYHEVINQMWQLLYETTAYIDPYACLPEDSSLDGVSIGVMGAHFPPAYFESATLNQVRRYLVLCTRGERFCDGHIAKQFEIGSIHAALKRVRHLRVSP